MLFLDTSALLKRYLDEAGREDVAQLMSSDSVWVASSLARAETDMSLCHLGYGDDGPRSRQAMMARDWEQIDEVLVDSDCLARARRIGCAYKLRTLDAIHLAAADRLERPITFVSFEVRQRAAALRLGMAVAPASIV